ncbi:MAG: HDIG domain-containing protein [Paludibacteraceae bacterium]|nr:HDIG domain-containing protein [Paludibacteraceae bacterium]MBO7233502.1 HDIG domain-containing protein [Paludibacteraceae bacterium]MBO7258916.1 HDIG domain-containing protein [Paludibacteraceae bacterium]
MNTPKPRTKQLLQDAETFALSILHKYYKTEETAYQILLTHSRQVAQKALQVIMTHPELKVNTTFVLQAAYLHDIGVFLCNAPIIGCNGTHQYIEHGYLGADLLRNEGLPKHALVAERHTGTGITHWQIVTQNLPIPTNRTYQPDTLEEKIVSYADKFYSKTHLDTCANTEKILKKLIKFGDESVQRFQMWDNIFG